MALILLHATASHVIKDINNMSVYNITGHVINVFDDNSRNNYDDASRHTCDNELCLPVCVCIRPVDTPVIMSFVHLSLCIRPVDTHVIMSFVHLSVSVSGQ